MKRAACWIPGLLVVVCASCGCQLRGHQQSAPPANTADDATPAATEKHVVVFAPVALGPLASIVAGGHTTFASDLASRMSWKDAELDGQSPGDLPDSDAQEWKDGTVPAAAGASLVVLTSVQELDSTTTPGTVVATVEMKAMDPAGATVFDKKAHGQSSTTASNLNGAKPESAAAWDACTTLLGALTTVIDARDNPAPAPAPAQAPAKADKIPVVIDSDPPHAQILIDGAASGTTPATLPLTVQAHAVRIELAGYEAWERKDIVPSAEMRIQPILHKTAAAGVTSAPGDSSPKPADSSAVATPPKDVPKRAEIDPTVSPPTPAQLVVPDDK
jgi:hypothetical protein